MLVGPVVGSVVRLGSANGLVVFTAIQAIYGAYCLFALWRMSRWPILLIMATTAANLVWRHQNDPHWVDAYPRLGVFVVLIPVGLLAALILPHWKRLNWNPLGRAPERKAEKPEEVF